MVVSYSDQGECPGRPPFCRCKSLENAHFQKRGIYVRKLVQVITHFFFCTKCQTHITMLPSSCVPFKHFPAKDIQFCLEGAVCGRRAGDIEADKGNRMGVHRSTIHRWLLEWIVNSAQLASIAPEKLSGSLSGGFKGIYQKLSRRYRNEDFFRLFQPDLCRDYPSMGIFRPLILLS